MELASIILVPKARKKGHTSYLAPVVNTQAIKNDLRSVPIVCEYLDVFLEEMSGLPLVRPAPKKKIIVAKQEL